MRMYLTPFVPIVPVFRNTGLDARDVRASLSSLFSLFSLISLCKKLGQLGQVKVSSKISGFYRVPKCWDTLGQLGQNDLKVSRRCGEGILNQLSRTVRDVKGNNHAHE
jgi:hypothetical protein